MAIFILIFFLLLIAYGFLIDYYRRAWNQLPEFTGSPEGSIKASVIVAVRNEEKNIAHLLDCLIAQDYASYEIIIIDDHSTDNTLAIIRSYPAVKVISLPENITGKKNAIKEGIKNSSGELIITTDADCIMPSSWISTIISFYNFSGAKFIAAPVNMKAGRSVLSVFQSLDFLTLQGITGASVHKKFHSMCNGANLAYTKESFDEVNGFDGIDNIPSGDDMLLMHKISERYPGKVFYLKSKAAIVTTEPEKTWKEFFNQRIRWASKSVHYKDKNIVYVLWLTYLINVLFFASFIISVFNTNLAGFFVLLFLAKVLIEFPFVNSVSVFFNQQKMMRYFILFQPLHILYIIISGWLGKFGSYTWKSRRINP